LFLQNQWNNFFLKKCGWRSLFYCTNVEEKVNSLLKILSKNNLQIKEQIHLEGQFVIFFLSNILFFLKIKKKKVSYKQFLEDLGLLTIKNNLLIKFVENT